VQARPRRHRPLDAGYTSEVDATDEAGWYRMLAEFDDANIFQTVAYGAATPRRGKLSHLVLRFEGVPVSIAQARIVRIPGVHLGIAYIRWGPMWRLRASASGVAAFRQCLRALRNEYACKRGLVLRVLPLLFDPDASVYMPMLAEEGFERVAGDAPSRTILMDLRPPLEQLRNGIRAHYKRELKRAERNGLEIVEGTTGDLFDALIEVHREMVRRKRFVEGSDIGRFRRVQDLLPEPLKMRIMLARSEAGVCAGLVCSAFATTAVYLFGATSDLGLKSNGSYLLHWKLIELLKNEGRAVYDLHGVNAEHNPGTYAFKRDLGGEHGSEVAFLGTFEAHEGWLGHRGVRFAERMRHKYRTLKEASRRA
jgi:hypothetical protein